MILLILAIAFSTFLLIVETQAYLRYHNEEDAILMVLSSAMLVSCITVLFVWRCA